MTECPRPHRPPQPQLEGNYCPACDTAWEYDEATGELYDPVSRDFAEALEIARERGRATA